MNGVEQPLYGSEGNIAWDRTLYLGKCAEEVRLARQKQCEEALERVRYLQGKKGV